MNRSQLRDWLAKAKDASSRDPQFRKSEEKVNERVVYIRVK